MFHACYSASTSSTSNRKRSASCTGVSVAPHELQNRASCGFSRPHDGHRSMCEPYDTGLDERWLHSVMAAQPARPGVLRSTRFFAPRASSLHAATYAHRELLAGLPARLQARYAPQVFLARNGMTEPRRSRSESALSRAWCLRRSAGDSGSEYLAKRRGQVPV
jgi:hypothetical protein